MLSLIVGEGSKLLVLSLLLVDLPARRHKLGCLCLSALISSRASAPRLADFDPRPTGGRAGGRAPAAPDGRAGACGARSTERLRRSLTARLRRDGLIPKKSAEGGRRRDEPGKENVELKNCIALVVI